MDAEERKEKVTEKLKSIQPTVKSLLSTDANKDFPEDKATMEGMSARFDAIAAQSEFSEEQVTHVIKEIEETTEKFNQLALVKKAEIQHPTTNAEWAALEEANPGKLFVVDV